MSGGWRGNDWRPDRPGGALLSLCPQTAILSLALITEHFEVSRDKFQEPMSLPTRVQLFAPSSGRTSKRHFDKKKKKKTNTELSHHRVFRCF